MTLDEIIHKANSFKGLTPGWCYGNEVPPDENTIKFSIKIIKALFRINLIDIDVFPGDINSIFIVPMKNDISLDIEVRHNKIISIEKQRGIGNKYEVLNFWENVSYELLSSIIYSLSMDTHNVTSVPWNTFGGETCISESSIPKNTTIEGDAMGRHALNHTKEEYQFLSVPAPSLSKYQYVITFELSSTQYSMAANQ